MRGRLRVLLALATLAYLWTTSGFPRRPAVRRGGDRGDGALSTAVIAVGLVLIAGVVLLILREKATETADNVCTAVDPTTCR
jgi:hypothetical protein